MEISRYTDDWGQTVLTSGGMFEFLMRGGDPSLLLVEDSEDVRIYNDQCRTRDKLDFLLGTYEQPACTPEEEHEARAATWLVSPPEGFDIEAFLYAKCETDAARQRVADELAIYRERNLYPLLSAMVRMVELWREHKVVWGVGRGSSVASYCLFLIGVHRIDSLKYDLDIRDFLK